MGLFSAVLDLCSFPSPHIPDMVPTPGPTPPAPPPPPPLPPSCPLTSAGASPTCAGGHPPPPPPPPLPPTHSSGGTLMCSSGPAPPPGAPPPPPAPPLPTGLFSPADDRPVSGLAAALAGAKLRKVARVRESWLTHLSLSSSTWWNPAFMFHMISSKPDCRVETFGSRDPVGFSVLPGRPSLKGCLPGWTEIPAGSRSSRTGSDFNVNPNPNPQFRTG